MAIKWDRRFYYWPDVFSRQTGTQGEFCIIAGGKGIGKTFGLRLQCVEDYITKGYRFCEICRTKEESKNVQAGYFDKLQNEGFFANHQFKTEKNCGYINRGTDENPEWDLICYFVALTAFQQEKKRTYVKPYRFIFDEAIIDIKDRYHRYLKDEFLILANLLDTISRQQPEDDYNYKVYLIGNACDLSCPYLRYAGVNKIPKYGFHWFNEKHTIFHYVPPMNAEARKSNTLVGRMLSGNDESKMIFNNEFAISGKGEIANKTANSKFVYGLIYEKMRFGIWVDYKRGIFYVNEQIPKGEKHIYALSKKDGTLDYQVIRKADGLMQILINTFYAGNMRYSSNYVREAFHTVLSFLGIQ